MHIHKAIALIAECSLPEAEALPAMARRKRGRAGSAAGSEAEETAGRGDGDDGDGDGVASDVSEGGEGGDAGASLSHYQALLAAQDAALVGASIAAATEGELASIVAARRTAVQRTGAVQRAAEGVFHDKDVEA